MSVFHQATLAQKNMRHSSGYIVKSGDTLRGEIQSDIQKRLHTVCKFRRAGSEDFIQYSPTEIESFFIQSHGLFVAKQQVPLSGKLKPENYFLQSLESGQASLYYLIESSGKGHYFVEKDTTLAELTKLDIMESNDLGQRVKRTVYHYRGTLQRMLPECPPNNIGKLNFAERSLRKAVFTYNKCMNPSYKRQFKKTSRFYLGYAAGIMQDNLIIDNLRTVVHLPYGEQRLVKIDSYNKSYSFQSRTMGLTFEQALGKNSHYSFLSALLYSTRTLTTQELKIDAATLEIPIQVKYSMLLKFRVRPYLYGGMIIPFTLKDDTKGTGIPTYSNSYAKEPEKDDQGNPYLFDPFSSNSFTPSRIHFVGGFGLDFIVSQRSKISGQCRFEGYSFFSSAYLDLHLSTTTITAGYSYRLFK
jgi:hypothetical protein